jgi:hypothetical protein
MADQYGPKTDTALGLHRQWKQIGTNPTTGEPIFAEVVALEPTSIGSGGSGGAASTPTTVRNNKVTVTTAGTRVALAGTTTIQGVVVRALDTNTGNIYVGSSAVDSTNGYVLGAGEAVGLAIDDLAKVYIDSSVNGEGVTYLGS